MPHGGRAWIHQVDVLLGVLVIKPDLMCHLMQVGRAQYTRVPVANVNAPRVARIPIGISFEDIVLCSWGHAGMTGGHSIPTCRTVSSIHHRGGMVRGRTAGITNLKSSWGTKRCAHGATNMAHGRGETALGKTPIVRDWLGPSLQNPKKTAEKSKFQELLDKPALQNPKKLQKNPRFENFWVL